MGDRKVKLRPYQVEAVEATYAYWADGKGRHPLIVAPTGAGKTAIIAQIVKDAMSYGNTRVMIVTHLKELLEQGAEGLLRMYPEANIGFYSASIGQKRIDKPITFAGIQSVWERAFDFVPAPDLVIIDEAHMLPKNDTTRYGKFISDLVIANPRVKVLGLTATHYRLDSGYLHKGEGAFFDGIAHEIPVTMLMEEGYLSTVISPKTQNQIDLTNVGKRGGEFIESELAVAACDPELVRRTVAEIVEHGRDRKSWLVFSSGLKHADMLGDQLREYGINCEIVKGSESLKDRASKISAFKNKGIRCLINCGVLTTGFDAPSIDLVAIVRATASTSLYVQIVGRGTRPVYAPGYDLETPEGRLAAIGNGTKPNCLVLDYGGNVERHGYIDAVRPTIKSAGKGDGLAPVKQCPTCEEMVHAAARVCMHCGHQFPPPELNHSHQAYDGAILTTQVEPEWLDVEDVIYQRHSKKDKPDSVKITYVCGFTSVSEWLCPDHGGFAATRYQQRKAVLGAWAETTEDALIECDQWNKPKRVQVRPSKHNPKFLEVLQLDYEEPKEELDFVHVPDKGQYQFFDDDIPF